jgi:hypothetical protein
MKTNYRKKKKELTTLRHYWLRQLDFNPFNGSAMALIRELNRTLKELKDSK